MANVSLGANWHTVSCKNRNFNFFLIIIYIQDKPNISAVVWFRSDKKPRTSSLKYVLNIGQFCGKNRASERKSVVIHFFAGWPKDRNDVIFLNLRSILSELCPKMCEILVFCAVAPPMGRLGQAFGFLVPATTTTIWPGFSSLALTVWAARSVLRRNNNNNKKNLNNYNRDSAFHARTPKNPNNYNRDSALRARTPN